MQHGAVAFRHPFLSAGAPAYGMPAAVPYGPTIEPPLPRFRAIDAAFSFQIQLRLSGKAGYPAEWESIMKTLANVDVAPTFTPSHTTFRPREAFRTGGSGYG